MSYVSSGTKHVDRLDVQQWRLEAKHGTSKPARQKQGRRPNLQAIVVSDVGICIVSVCDALAYRNVAEPACPTAIAGGREDEEEEDEEEEVEEEGGGNIGSRDHQRM